MWTHSGMYVEKRKKLYHVYSDDEKELEIFTNGHGYLLPEYITDEFEKDGLYQVWTGYGQIGSMQDPGIYKALWLCNINWELEQI